MKKLSLLLLSFITSTFGLGATTETPYGLRTFKCTPLYVDGSTSTFSFDATCTIAKKVKIEIFLINDFYPEGKSLYSGSLSRKGIINLKYNNEYTRPKGNSILIKETLSDGSVKTYNHSIEVAKSQFCKINDANYSYESTSSFYTLTNKKWSVIKEQYNFYNFEEFYFPNYYHKINISDFSLKPISSFESNTVIFNEAKFLISNRDGIFDSFEHDKSYAYFNLNLVSSKNGFNLAFKDQLYVNPTTLEMSSTPKDGFVKTNYLYLPRNEKRIENSYDCTILISGLGIDKSDFMTKFKYKSLLNTFGDCRNSEYCIVNS